MPERIQRKRVKGWKMPPNTIYVGRPGKFGNPYSIRPGECGLSTGAREVLVKDFEYWLKHPHDRYERPGTFKAPGFASCAESREARDMLLQSLSELRGKNLACWCPIGQPCHADVLLRLANVDEAAK